MCKEASTGLGTTNGSRPANGNRGVGNSSNTCPRKKANALLLVYVYLRDSSEAVQNAQVNLTGTQADAGPTDIYGTKSFPGLPAGEYRASIKVDHIPDLKGSRLEAVNDQLILGA